jgi:hypothetical protein
VGELDLSGRHYGAVKHLRLIVCSIASVRNICSSGVEADERRGIEVDHELGSLRDLVISDLASWVASRHNAEYKLSAIRHIHGSWPRRPRGGVS